MFASWWFAAVCGVVASVVFLQFGFVLDLVGLLLLWLGSWFGVWWIGFGGLCLWVTVFGGGLLAG